jgi:hypothetical protein
MARRVSLPSADSLFRTTEEEKAQKAAAAGEAGLRQSGGASRLRRATVHAVPDPDPSQEDAGVLRRPSGRVKHDEKMTVYVTSGELLQLEHARLSLRSEHGLVVDRGRLVREAMALVLADLELNGEASALVRLLNLDEE